MGCTLHRLAAKCAISRVKTSVSSALAKCAISRVKTSVSSVLALLQLGFGVPKGAEAAIHAARIYVQNLTPDSALLKVDFTNAFNSLHRDNMFLAVSIWVSFKPSSEIG